LVKEIVSIFSSEIPRYLAKIEQAIDKGDFETIAIITHTIKGSVSNFGVPEVSDALIALEAAAKRKNRDDTLVKLDLAKGLLNELIAAFSK